MTKRREHRVELNEKAGLSGSSVDYLVRQTRYESELISTSLMFMRRYFGRYGCGIVHRGRIKLNYSNPPVRLQRSHLSQHPASQPMSEWQALALALVWCNSNRRAIFDRRQPIGANPCRRRLRTSRSIFCDVEAELSWASGIT